jgi:hypothetical protein
VTALQFGAHTSHQEAHFEGSKNAAMRLPRLPCCCAKTCAAAGPIDGVWFSIRYSGSCSGGSGCRTSKACAAVESPAVPCTSRNISWMEKQQLMLSFCPSQCSGQCTIEVLLCHPAEQGC